ncbi:Hypothetical_protein [Hexamita inflata]|uniref:Hypothetical_protein n=1 Tax=Hexamita inflata TaxID=28002 RepID=A0AA86QU33_9EUKA|nr:Hypothetical protein HINF_LOCUS49151 [Hexamita inflata]
MKIFAIEDAKIQFEQLKFKQQEMTQIVDAQVVQINALQQQVQLLHEQLFIAQQETKSQQSEAKNYSNETTLSKSQAKDLTDQNWKQSVRIKRLEQQIVSNCAISSMDAQTLESMHQQIIIQLTKLKKSLKYPQNIGTVHQFRLQFDNDLSWVQLAHIIKTDWRAINPNQMFQTIKTFVQNQVNYVKYAQNAIVLQNAFRFKYAVLVVYAQEVDFLQCYLSVDKI